MTSEDSPTEDGSPVEESLATDEEAPASDSQSSGDESVLGSEGSSAEDPGLPAEEPADESPITPGDPSDEEEAAQAVDPGAADASSPPTQNQLGGTGAADEPTMADTATPSLPVSSGLAATLGVLMLIAAHATIRRGKRSPSRA